jgi:hypothetical protein
MPTECPVTATVPLPVPRRDPTSAAALRAIADDRADTTPAATARVAPCVRYAGAGVRRGARQRLEVTLLDAVKWPLRWECEATG